MNPPANEPKEEIPQAKVYIRRALQLKCPECGVSPIFMPLKQTRTLFDWLTPLDGCPRCGYAYKREDGYFLLAIWGVNYGLIAGLGLTVALIIEWIHPLTMWQYAFIVFSPMPFLSMLFARHAKALFLAMDHFFDPQGPGKIALMRQQSSSNKTN